MLWTLYRARGECAWSEIGRRFITSYPRQLDHFGTHGEYGGHLPRVQDLETLSRTRRFSCRCTYSSLVVSRSSVPRWAFPNLVVHPTRAQESEPLRKPFAIP